jgi:hypothetical protein
MAAADAKKALIVAVHHPVYSFDDHHSGSPTMAKELEDAGRSWQGIAASLRSSQ